MFGYRSNVPKVRLTTDRLVVRLVHERDAAASGGLLRRESPVFKTPGTRSGREPLLPLWLAGAPQYDCGIS